MRALLTTLALALLFTATGCARPPAARLEVLSIPGETLRENPLGDPVARRVALFVPQGVAPGTPLPIVYFLPGYGGSSEDFIAQGAGSTFAILAQRLAEAGQPLLIAVPDCRNRWGGSQYLNSTAQGRYADYLADEVIPAVERAFPLAGGPAGRFVAGHSSGGYGALMIAMARPRLFGGVIALAPDSDFDTTHRSLVEHRAVRRVTPAEVAAYSGPAASAPRPGDGALELTLGLSAAYAAIGPGQPGRFHWLYDERGQWQPQVWQRWLALDPLVIVREKKDPFASETRLYLDGSARDDWGFNVSARKLHDLLAARRSGVTFHEPPGGHSDHLAARLERGLRWMLGLPLNEIP